jgi:hypothetical protein
MKIAICLSGHMRNYMSLLDNFNELKDFLKSIGDLDIFISTWDKKNGISWSSVHGLTSVNNSEKIDAEQLSEIYKIDKENISINNEDFFSSNYSPIKYNLFSNNTYNWHSLGMNNNIVHSTKQMFTFWNCNLIKLKKEFDNNKKYDIVIKTRPDFKHNSENIKNFILNIYEKEYLYLQDNEKETLEECYIPGNGYLKYGLDFCIGTSDKVDVFTSAFYRISIANENNIFGAPESVFSKIMYNKLGNVKNVHNLPGMFELIR